MDDQINVYLELGTKKVFAGAVDWPGWCRPGKDEQSALQVLANFAPRYARVMEGSGLHFQKPASQFSFEVSERVKGTSSTDFGAPDVAPSADSRPVGEVELHDFCLLLAACWEYLDQMASRAQDKELRKGPRGGGRELMEILRHVMEGERGYLTRLAWKPSRLSGDLEQDMRETRRDVINTLETAVRQGLPESGPRGGKIWTARYFVRRASWHILDHAWELEDRILPALKA